jgi:hypothetical protein
MTQYDALSFETAGEMGVKSHTHPHPPVRAHEGEVRHVRHVRHWRGAKPVVR